MHSIHTLVVDNTSSGGSGSVPGRPTSPWAVTPAWGKKAHGRARQWSEDIWGRRDSAGPISPPLKRSQTQIGFLSLNKVRVMVSWTLSNPAPPVGSTVLGRHLEMLLARWKHWRLCPHLDVFFPRARGQAQPPLWLRSTPCAPSGETRAAPSARDGRTESGPCFHRRPKRVQFWGRWHGSSLFVFPLKSKRSA